MSDFSDPAVLIFAATVLATFFVSFLGRRHSRRRDGRSVHDQRLNKWLVGLSAGATANSGFVVTGAVGLGYSFGAQWLMLPLAWLVGDIIFWTMFPHRINSAAQKSRASTMSDIITDGLSPKASRMIKRAVATIALICLGGYVSAQWIAGEKFLAGAFSFSESNSLFLFSAVIIVYTAIGGFRGSIYTDSLQAVIRLIGTIIAIFAITWVAVEQKDAFWLNIERAGPDFISLAPQGPVMILLFVLGYSAAALGFGLGQPQMVTRYMAGSGPAETQAAWWVYIGFVQFTWISMTVFGIALRGVMPGLTEPETGLSVFFRSETGAVLTGIIVADIFATIAATSNSLLVAMAQTAKYDLFLQPSGVRDGKGLWPVTALIGGATMLIASHLTTSVVDLAISSVALMGSGLAPAMVTRVLGWRRSGASVLISMLAGVGSAGAWKLFGYSVVINESFIGISVGLFFGWMICLIQDLRYSHE